MQVVHYYTSSTSTAGSPLCSVSGKFTACGLSGWLYRPSGPAPFPAIVLNHSSENPRVESDYCPIVEYFLNEGYLVFEPVRRGFSGNAGLGTNTGELPKTTLARLIAGGKPLPRSPIAAVLLGLCTSHDDRIGNVADPDCLSTELQADQVREVQEAVAFLKRLNILGFPTINPNRIALIGHAMGANITLMSGLAGVPGVQAGVLVSPAERNWDHDHPYLTWYLFQSMRARKFSIAVMQPRNGQSVSPTWVLSEAAITTQDHEFMAALLPAVGVDDPAEIQRRFATRANHVNRWAPLAWRFLHLNGVK